MTDDLAARSAALAGQSRPYNSTSRSTENTGRLPPMAMSPETAVAQARIRAHATGHVPSTEIFGLAGNELCDSCARPWPCPTVRGVKSKAARRPIVRPSPKTLESTTRPCVSTPDTVT